MNLEVYMLVTNQLNFFRIQPIMQFKHIFVFYVDNSVRIAASLRLRNEIGERLFSHRSVKSRDLGVWGEEEFGISSSCKNYLLTWVI